MHMGRQSQNAGIDFALVPHEESEEVLGAVTLIHIQSMSGIFTVFHITAAGDGMGHRKDQKARKTQLSPLFDLTPDIFKRCNRDGVVRLPTV